jgi:hypothetical protein
VENEFHEGKMKLIRLKKQQDEEVKELRNIFERVVESCKMTLIYSGGGVPAPKCYCVFIFALKKIFFIA